MKLTVKGVPGQPIALFIHPALTGPAYFDGIIDALKGRYRVALPTLDGHYDNAPDFAGIGRSADELARHLRAEGIDHVEVLLGCQLGANVGLRLLGTLPRGMVRRAVFDGAALETSGLGRTLYLRELRRIAKAARTGKPGAARKLVDSRDDDYVDLVVDQARSASDATLCAIADACFGGTDDARGLPELPEAMQGFVTFTWGSYDQGSKCATRLSRTYPRAHIDIKRGLPPYSYLLDNSERYVEEYLI